MQTASGKLFILYQLALKKINISPFKKGIVTIMCLKLEQYEFYQVKV
jgi:hypothetical protein